MPCTCTLPYAPVQCSAIKSNKSMHAIQILMFLSIQTLFVCNYDNSIISRNTLASIFALISSDETSNFKCDTILLVRIAEKIISIN